MRSRLHTRLGRTLTVVGLVTALLIPSVAPTAAQTSNV